MLPFNPNTDCLRASTNFFLLRTASGGILFLLQGESVQTPWPMLGMRRHNTTLKPLKMERPWKTSRNAFERVVSVPSPHLRPLSSPNSFNVRRHAAFLCIHVSCSGTKKPTPASKLNFILSMTLVYLGHLTTGLRSVATDDVVLKHGADISKNYSSIPFSSPGITLAVIH